jgi:hypothetical protein
MAAESVSFRISRNTEDLAQATHALSQRLVKLEQRLQAMELQLTRLHDSASNREPDELASLETVERLLHDCRCLLGLDGPSEGSDDSDGLPAGADLALRSSGQPQAA